MLGAPVGLLTEAKGIPVEGARLLVSCCWSNSERPPSTASAYERPLSLMELDEGAGPVRVGF